MGAILKWGDLTCIQPEEAPVCLFLDLGFSPGISSVQI
jgi:hypothetical protein